MTDRAQSSNRLIAEKSPYLLQHAHNPVDWYPWGDEAFQRAEQENKPIFLSIGYSTCHWCHVMERESFENQEVAQILNESYISVKVDREERPDIDTIYMSACQGMTGSGGWPLTIIMTPDKKPFFSGTYFPPHQTDRMPGLTDILTRAAEMWRDEQDKLLQSADDITAALSTHMFTTAAGEPSDDALAQAAASLASRFDTDHGGFGPAPKFPTPHNLTFLLRFQKTAGEAGALCREMVHSTLDAMYLGGLWDHIGFGFTRYSTDDKWLVPHFEKMLYDNALLAIAYLEGYQVLAKEEYQQVARQIFTYILRDMTDPQGGFYTAEDADTEGEEGLFYLWTPAEVKEVLGDDLGSRFCQAYDISEGGNFEGQSIPNLIQSRFVDGYQQAVGQLFERRQQRTRPFKDDKILTGWNGLMIAALAYGARVLGDASYAQAAEKAAAFITARLRRPDGRLLARFRDDQAAIPAYLHDYAYYVWGLIELHQTTFDPLYLNQAVEYTRDMIRLFWDDSAGGFYLYGSDAEDQIARPKEIYDSATPSGNSVAAMNLIRLSRLTGDPELKDISQKQLQAFGGTVSEAPAAYTHFLMALWLDRTPPAEITVVGDPQAEDTRDFLQRIGRRYLPEAAISLKPLDSAAADSSHIAPFAQDKEASNNQTTVHICKDFSCLPPADTAQDLDQLLGD